MMKLTLCLVLLAVAPFCLSERPNYENHKVYRVIPKTVQEADVLKGFEKLREHIDFWNTIRVLGKPVDVMVAPVFQGVFQFTLKTKGIEFVELISNVEKTMQEELLRNNIAPRAGAGKINFQQYHRYDVITSYLLQLQKDHPDIVTVEYPGKSFEGRDLAMIKISAGTNKPIILVDAGIHAREWIAPAMALYMINQLVENPANRHMIENVEWHIIPVLNPDGYEYSHRQYRLWRKTRSTGEMCFGVDGNRNFDFHWMEVGASSWECDDTYAGPHAQSEIETQLLKKVVEKYNSRIKLYLTFHSYGNYILYPWGYTSGLPDNWKVLDALAVDAEKALSSVSGTRYTIGSSTNVLYAAAGGSDDWVKAVGGVELAYTLELPGGGSWGFDLPPSRITPVVFETFEAIKVYHQYIENNFN